MKNKYTYVWVSLIILVFGIIFIPKIVDRIRAGTVVQNDRMNVKDNSQELSYVLLNGKREGFPILSSLIKIVFSLRIKIIREKYLW